MHRILLLLDHEGNRRLIAGSLSRSLACEVVEPAGDVPPEGEVDLCVLGPRALERHRAWIDERRRRSAPVFLPCLLVASRPGQGARARETVDDVITVPVEQAELHARVRTLLRTRRLSLELRDRHAELEALHREVQEQNVHLEQLNRQKSELLGMAAHDLRNPLGVISGYTDFILEEAAEELDDRVVGFLSRIRGSSQFMLDLVNDILDLSAIEAGTLNLRPVEADLVPLVRLNAEMNATLAQQKGIDLVFEAEEDLPRVMVDPDKLEQILNNLVSNAVKFSHAGTGVRVALRRADGGVVLSVRDEGQGIPEAEIDRLFTPFGKGSVRATAGEKSTGLGLAIVKRIVEGHGGWIRVDSAVGRGSTFRVLFPAQGG